MVIPLMWMPMARRIGTQITIRTRHSTTKIGACSNAAQSGARRCEGVDFRARPPHLLKATRLCLTAPHGVGLRVVWGR